MTEATPLFDDSRFFCNGPVKQIAITPAILARLAPPPADPPSVKPKEWRVEAPTKSPRSGHSRGSGSNRKAGSGAVSHPKRLSASECLHPRWEEQGPRGYNMRIRCRTCPTHRTVTVTIAKDLCSREVLPSEVPASQTGGSKGLPPEHGTHRTYRRGGPDGKGCRCELCKAAKNAANMACYYTRTGGKPRVKGVMPPAYAQALEMKQQGLTAKQIAASTGKTENTIHSYWQAARKWLKKNESQSEAARDMAAGRTGSRATRN